MATRKEKSGLLARLKKAGLFTGNVRKASKNSYGRALIAKFDDWLHGIARIIPFRSHKRAKEVAEASGAIVRGKRVIVTAPNFGQTNPIRPKFYVSKNQLVARYYFNGVGYDVYNIPRADTLADLPRLDTKNENFILIHPHGAIQTFTLERLELLARAYNPEQREKFLSILPYLNVMRSFNEKEGKQRGKVA